MPYFIFSLSLLYCIFSLLQWINNKIPCKYIGEGERERGREREERERERKRERERERERERLYNALAWIEKHHLTDKK